MHTVVHSRIAADGDGNGILLTILFLIRCRGGSIVIFSLLVVFLAVVLLAAGIGRCIGDFLLRRGRLGLVCLAVLVALGRVRVALGIEIRYAVRFTLRSGSRCILLSEAEGVRDPGIPRLLFFWLISGFTHIVQIQSTVGAVNSGLRAGAQAQQHHERQQRRNDISKIFLHFYSPSAIRAVDFEDAGEAGKPLPLYGKDYGIRRLGLAF